MIPGRINEIDFPCGPCDDDSGSLGMRNVETCACARCSEKLNSNCGMDRIRPMDTGVVRCKSGGDWGRIKRSRPGGRRSSVLR